MTEHGIGLFLELLDEALQIQVVEEQDREKAIQEAAAAIPRRGNFFGAFFKEVDRVMGVGFGNYAARTWNDWGAWRVRMEPATRAKLVNVVKRPQFNPIYW